VILGEHRDEKNSRKKTLDEALTPEARPGRREIGSFPRLRRKCRLPHVTTRNAGDYSTTSGNRLKPINNLKTPPTQANAKVGLLFSKQKTTSWRFLYLTNMLTFAGAMGWY